MKLLHFTAPSATFRLALIADWHLGARQCRVAGIRRFVSRIQKDPHCYWIALGDLTENALITSLGDVYKQQISPEDQIDLAVKILEPIKERCLGMIRGNHGKRTKKQADIDIDRSIARYLGVDYYGITLAGSIMIPSGAKYFIVAHHGKGRSTNSGTKLNSAKKLEQIWERADIQIMAHHHDITFNATRKKYLERAKGQTFARWQTHYTVLTGSALDYEDSYAEDQLMQPAAIAQVILTLHPRQHKSRDKNAPDNWVKKVSFEIVDI